MKAASPRQPGFRVPRRSSSVILRPSTWMKLLLTHARENAREGLGNRSEKTGKLGFGNVEFEGLRGPAAVAQVKKIGGQSPGHFLQGEVLDQVREAAQPLGEDSQHVQGEGGFAFQQFDESLSWKKQIPDWPPGFRRGPDNCRRQTWGLRQRSSPLAKMWRICSFPSRESL